MKIHKFSIKDAEKTASYTFIIETESILLKFVLHDYDFIRIHQLRSNM